MNRWESTGDPQQDFARELAEIEESGPLGRVYIFFFTALAVKALALTVAVTIYTVGVVPLPGRTIPVSPLPVNTKAIGQPIT